MLTWAAAPVTARSLSWGDQDKPKVDVQAVEIQVDLDTERFYKMFVDLLTAPTPH